jgi:hypothetical protein
MNNSEKKNMLENKLNDLLSYKNSLSQDNIDDFNNLKRYGSCCLTNNLIF